MSPCKKCTSCWRTTRTFHRPPGNSWIIFYQGTSDGHLARTIHSVPTKKVRAGWVRFLKAGGHDHATTQALEDGRICLTNNAAERALRCVAVGRRNWTFCGSDRGGERAAAIYTLIASAKLNNVDPKAWLVDVLRRINDQPASRLGELLPWNWKGGPAKLAA